ncbi:OLC1v1016608C1 [Oldenlandia corymbosa var. corymbosa]|uniref:OLC1v1016608C1 n=1 Tax=Oldenlandia corymbosa var. corymbosa TaxID=529605 RepID=A0AAV1E624_OLDCO|nr:OLC1v1016608C1 [Oldenlandia corymbosa var. corymbosa]
MSGFEDDRLSQMIRDYIEFDSSSSHSSSPKSLSSVDDHQSSLTTLQEILGSVTLDEAEILGKIFGCRRDLEPSKLRKWIVMKLGMEDHYEASLCTTSWVTKTPSNKQCPSGYEYIEVMMKKGVRLIVDIDFRSQFKLARPTPQYEDMLNSVPKIFVGTEMKLEKVITLMCSAGKKSLRERELHIPPWRKASYLHSKWLSKDCKKISFSDLSVSDD